jgi:hypothetical protein
MDGIAHRERRLQGVHRTGPGKRRVADRLADMTHSQKLEQQPAHNDMRRERGWQGCGLLTAQGVWPAFDTYSYQWHSSRSNCTAAACRACVYTVCTGCSKRTKALCVPTAAAFQPGHNVGVASQLLKDPHHTCDKPGPQLLPSCSDTDTECAQACATSRDSEGKHPGT